MPEERKYFDAEKLIHRLYTKIAIWHNNEDKLNDVEMGRELRFLCKDITNDVLTTVLGGSEMKIDEGMLHKEQGEKDASEGH